MKLCEKLSEDDDRTTSKSCV